MHAAAPPRHTGHASGTRNGRGRSGSLYRSTSTPTHTSTKANSVPMFVRSYVSPASPTSDASATTMPVINVVTCGTRCFTLTLAAHSGSRPSRAMAKKIRGWPYWKTRRTADIDTAAPSATIQPTGVKPHDQAERAQLDDHHDVVRGRALARALEQQPGDEHHDRGRRHVDEHRHAGHVRRRRQQPVDLWIAAQQRRAIAGAEPRRNHQSDAGEQRLDVVAPGNRDGDV